MFTVAELQKALVDEAWDNTIPTYVKIGENYHEVTEVYHDDSSGEDEVILEVDPNPVS